MIRLHFPYRVMKLNPPDTFDLSGKTVIPVSVSEDWAICGLMLPDGGISEERYNIRPWLLRAI